MVDHVDLHNEPCHGGTVPSASKPRVAATTQEYMKTISRLMAAFVAVFIILFAAAPQGFAQGVINGIINVEWYQDRDVPGVVFSTPTTNIGGVCTAALAPITSYSVRLLIDGNNASLVRENITPYGPGADTAYSVGPIAVNGNGTVIRFNTWINPSAQLLSAETINNITVNGIPLPPAVSANMAHPEGLYEYVSTSPIHEVTFNYTIYAVSASAETGVGFQITSVPEPSTAALFGLSMAMLLIFRRR